MILPSKHLPPDRALLTQGARILEYLTKPMTVSALWERIKPDRKSKTAPRSLRYDTFVLTLDLLFLMGAVDLKEGLLARRRP